MATAPPFPFPPRPFPRPFVAEPGDLVVLELICGSDDDEPLDWTLEKRVLHVPGPQVKAFLQQLQGK